MKKLVFGLFFGFLSLICSGENTAEMYLSNDAILLGQTDTLTLVFKTDQEAVELPLFNDTLSKTVEIYGTSDWDTLYDEAQFSFVKKLYITSFDSGYQVVPPVKFKIGNDEFETRPVLLHVKGEEVRLNENIKDIAPIEDFPITWKEILFYSCCVVVILLLLVIGYKLVKRYYLTKNNNELLDTEELLVVPFMDKFWEELSTLKKEVELEKSWGVSFEKSACSKLSELLRMYLEHRFMIQAMENTTSRILKQTTNKIEGAHLQEQVRAMLLWTDQVKFAKARVVKKELVFSTIELEKFVRETEVKENIEKEVEEING